MDYNDESIMLDATIVRAHPCAAGYKKGKMIEPTVLSSNSRDTNKNRPYQDLTGAIFCRAYDRVKEAS